jgi:hypothetical protein
MTHKFQPGDIVRPIATQTVQSVEHHRLGDILSFDDGWGAATDYELATPSVSIMKLREVLGEAKYSVPSARMQRLIGRIYETLTGEVMP